MKKEILELKRLQSKNGRTLLKKSENKIDAVFFSKVEKLTHDLGVLKGKITEENGKILKIHENVANIREYMRKENQEIEELKMKADLDFEEFSEKNLQESEKKYWKLIMKKDIISDHLRSVENINAR